MNYSSTEILKLFLSTKKSKIGVTILYEDRTVVFIKVCKILKHGGLLVYSQLTSVSKSNIKRIPYLKFPLYPIAIYMHACIKWTLIL